MQLRKARLCMDCEEVHDAYHCPVCASESFAYLTRWIPIEERRRQPRPPIEETPAPSAAMTWTKRGAVGLVALGVSGWLWRTVRNGQTASQRPLSGERDKDAG